MGGRCLKVFHLLVVLSLYEKSGLASTTAAEDATKRCIERERLALLKLKEGLTDDYGSLSSWRSEDKNCCNWERVHCNNKTGHMNMLDLRGKSEQSLGGKLGNSLLQLQHLNYLDLSGNSFSWEDSLQSLGSLTKLRYLNLSFSPVDGAFLYKLGNLTSLQTLDLSKNFVSKIENLSWVSHLSSLKFLDLSSNDLSQVNDWVEVVNSLPSLTNLYLDSCNLPDIVPSPLSHSNFSTSLATLVLSGNNLTSSIYQWLFNYSSSLVDLDLHYNRLQGSIPDAFGSMASLEYLDLGNNKLEGEMPKTFKNACQLHTLELSANKLSEPLQEFMLIWSGCMNTSLEVLNLWGNEIMGSLPNLTIFSSLKILTLGYNRLNGTVTTSIAHLPNLVSLDLSWNSLEGVISETHFSNLSKLKELDLSYNSLTLKFSSDWVPRFQLSYANLGFCKLGPDFPTWLQSQSSISALDVSGAEISDVVPTWFWDFSSRLNNLNLSYNQLSGMLPDLSMKFSDFPGLDFSSNHFEGQVPLLPPNVSSINLSNNSFSGRISFLCAITGGNLGYLDLSNNQLSGGFPDCCDSFQELAIINLANNNLSGEIACSIGSLSKLQSLNLRGNNFSGELPSCLKNCNELKAINLAKNSFSGKIPAWIGQNLSNLIVFSLRANKLYGNIPFYLCNLSHIRVLDLSINNISGTIPKCFSNLTAMATNAGTDTSIFFLFMASGGVGFAAGAYYSEEALLGWKGEEYQFRKNLGLVKIIDLSSNKLTGEFPSEITELIGLVSLNLSRNNLSGDIPPEIGQLKSLDFLDLSRNHLVGKIPSTLSQLDRLSVLDLSNNNLSGKIPTGTQLQSFNASSYEGNRGLCGPPLPNRCSGEVAQDPVVTRDSGSAGNQEDEDGFITAGFYVSLGVGFVVGF